MANERMFLLHAPSGYYVRLGKRMGWGWYGVPQDIAQRIQRLYDLIETQEAEGDQDYLVVAFDGDPRLRTHVEANENTTDTPAS
jgi:hypothetical protein